MSTETTEKPQNPEPSNKAPSLNEAYDELRRIAGAYMRRERSGHTLQPTALLHEAYMRMKDQDKPWQSRTQFMATAAQMMRRILIDHARKSLADKRGGGAVRTELSENLNGEHYDAEMVLAVNEVVEKLREVAPRACQVTELKYFSGMENDEIADHLGISLATVKREWSMAKAFLHRRLTSSPATAVR